ncbi:MAG: hypothetical protein NUV51_13390 [Sulfuricaulis sp.]|nr:hypothetical protein [Sulfuricaulis sp.]
MNMNQFSGIVSAVAIAGFTHSLAAQEKPEVNQTDNAPPAAVSEQELMVQPIPPVSTAPAQVIVQTEEKFLSEMKVYPAF